MEVLGGNRFGGDRLPPALDQVHGEGVLLPIPSSPHLQVSSGKNLLRHQKPADVMSEKLQ